MVLPKGTKYINNNAFNGCAYIQSIKMPATMDHINDDIFVGCSALKDVYCYAEEVPEFIGVNDPSAMNDVFANATLHVVFGHEQAYKADAWWKRFINVVGCDAPSEDEVTSVVLNQTELTMKPDDTIQLTATVYPTNAANKRWYGPAAMMRWQWSPKTDLYWPWQKARRTSPLLRQKTAA